MASKRLDGKVSWNKDGTDWWAFQASLSIDEVSIEGLFLRGKAAQNYVDRHVMLQIEYHVLPNEKGLARAEWRPFGCHNNGGIGPKDLQFVDQNGSHLHCFYQNYLADNDRMRARNLPIALPISPDHETCQEYIDEIGKYFRISNMDEVVLPPAQAVFL